MNSTMRSPRSERATKLLPGSTLLIVVAVLGVAICFAQIQCQEEEEEKSIFVVRFEQLIKSIEESRALLMEQIVLECGSGGDHGDHDDHDGEQHDCQSPLIEMVVESIVEEIKKLAEMKVRIETAALAASAKMGLAEMIKMRQHEELEKVRAEVCPEQKEQPLCKAISAALSD